MRNTSLNFSMDVFYLIEEKIKKFHFNSNILEVVQNFTQLHESIFQSLLEKVDFDVEDTEEMLDEITKQFRDYLSDFQNLADIGKGYCFEIDSRFEDRLEL